MEFGLYEMSDCFVSFLPLCQIFVFSKALDQNMATTLCGVLPPEVKRPNHKADHAPQ